MRLAVLLLAACMAAGASAAAELPGDSVYQLPVQMTDQNGTTVRWRNLHGRPRLVSMFYADCRLTCPLIVESGKAIQQRLTAQEYGNLDVVLVSLDPEHDTPDILTRVAQRHRVDSERWMLLRPAADDVRAIAGALGIRYRVRADGGIDHTSAWLLIDTEGRVLGRSESIFGAPDPHFLDLVRRTAAAP